MLTGAHDLDDLLQRIEWGTLLFFAALFILMEVGRAKQRAPCITRSRSQVRHQLNNFSAPLPHFCTPSQALSELGLIAFIGNKTAALIKDVCHALVVSQKFRAAGPNFASTLGTQVPEDSRLTVGMVLILWISAFAS